MSRLSAFVAALAVVTATPAWSATSSRPGSLLLATEGTQSHGTLVAKDADDEGGKDGKKEKKIDFLRQFFPFSLNDDLTEAVDDIVVLTYILNILPLGALWYPLIALDDGPDLNGDIALAYLVPVGVGVAWSFGWWAIAAVASIPTGGLCGIVGCLGCLAVVPYFWIAPTAVLNAWDFAYKHPGEKQFKKGGKKGKGGGSREGGKKSEPKAEPKTESKSGDQPYGY